MCMYMQFCTKIFAPLCVVIHNREDLFHVLHYSGLVFSIVIMNRSNLSEGEVRNVKFVLKIEKQSAIWDFRDPKHSKRTEFDEA